MEDLLYQFKLIPRPSLKYRYFSSHLEISFLRCFQALCKHYSLACSFWTSAGSSPAISSTQVIFSPPISSPSNNFLYTLLSVGGRAHALSQATWWIRDLNKWFHVLCGQMFKGRKVQTTKPFGEGGKVPREKGTRHHISSSFYKGFSRQSGLMDSGELQRQKPHHAVTVVVLSTDDSSSPTLCCGTGISATLGTAAIFAVWKRADNMSHHTTEELNSLGP